MIVQALQLLAFAAVGAALGALYLGGLWLTVRRLPGQRHPGLWLLTSAALRLTLLLGLLFLLTQGAWAQLGACLVGFVAIRTCLLRRMRPSPTTATAA